MDHRLCDPVFRHLPIRADFHQTAQSQTVLSLIEGTDPIGKLSWQHRDHAVRQINTGSSFQRLFIQRRACLHVIAHICDMNAQQIAIPVHGQRNRIVQILCILSIDRHHLPVSQIQPSVKIVWDHALRTAACHLLYFRRKFFRKFIDIHNILYIHRLKTRFFLLISIPSETSISPVFLPAFLARSPVFRTVSEPSRSSVLVRAVRIIFAMCRHSPCRTAFLILSACNDIRLAFFHQFFQNLRQFISLIPRDLQQHRHIFCTHRHIILGGQQIQDHFLSVFKQLLIPAPRFSSVCLHVLFLFCIFFFAFSAHSSLFSFFFCITKNREPFAQLPCLKSSCLKPLTI